MSNCQQCKMSNCQIVNCQIVTISNVTYYQSVGIRLAHRLYCDFQYFFIGFAKILHRRFQLEAHVHDPAPHKYGKNSLAHGADSRVFLQKKVFQLLAPRGEVRGK